MLLDANGCVGCFDSLIMVLTASYREYVISM